MRVLFDTNIILDIALMRVPHYVDSVNVLNKVDNKSIFGFITATTITDIYYVSKKEKGHLIAFEFISNIIKLLDVIGIDKAIIIESLASKLTDFEDAIQSAASSFNNIDYIITRNKKDFKNSEIEALTPIKLLNQILK